MKHKIVINYIGDRAHTFFVDSEKSTEDLLEQIFAWFNHGSGQECTEFLVKRMRSLSVNDCVRLDGQWYQCRGLGWEKVSEEFVDQLEKDVVQHPEFAKSGGWRCLWDVMWKKHNQLV